MANITASMVKELREITGAGMMDCKKALGAVDGDMDKAIEELRKKGLSKAAKKSDRIAAEGLVTIKVTDDFTKGTLSEINSETDFVAKNENFQQLVQDTTMHIQTCGCNEVEELTETEIDGTKFSEYLNNQIAKIGENIVVRRFATVATDNGVVNGYVHSNGKVGVLLAAKCDEGAKEKAAELLKGVAMHASAMKPAYLNESQIDEATIEKEKEIATAQLIKEGKPEKMMDKILPGKIKKFVNENTLLGQNYVLDESGKKSVAQAIKECDSSIELVDYIRFELGEGIEKKADDFASEVAAQLG
jgi:elongation factor Ts